MVRNIFYKDSQNPENCQFRQGSRKSIGMNSRAAPPPPVGGLKHTFPPVRPLAEPSTDKLNYKSQ